MEHVSCFYQCSSLVPVFVGIEHLGKTELAVSNITRSVSALFFVIVNSFAVTTGALISNSIGAGEKKQISSLSAEKF